MELFFVIVLRGIVIASVGPLPYGMEECEDRRAMWADEFAYYAEIDHSEVSDDVGEWEPHCVKSEIKPMLGETFYQEG